MTLLATIQEAIDALAEDDKPTAMRLLDRLYDEVSDLVDGIVNQARTAQLLRERFAPAPPARRKATPAEAWSARALLAHAPPVHYRRVLTLENEQDIAAKAQADADYDAAQERAAREQAELEAVPAVKTI